MGIGDYDKKKVLSVDSVSGTPTVDKAQPVIISGEEAFNINIASLNDFLDSGTEDFRPNGVTFSDTGDKLFIAGFENNNIYEYSLSTSFDVSTASFTDSFDVSGQVGSAKGVTFNNNGDKMFVSDGFNRKIYEYSLSTSFDVSTASFTDSFDVSSQDGEPEGVAFNNTGDKMFVTGSSNANVYEYSLSTSFDVSTASFTDSFDVSSQDDVPTGAAFSSSGDKMFVSGRFSANIYEYSLSTSFDVSTASFTDSFDVSSEDGRPLGVEFSDTGDKMFVPGLDTDNVYEYSLGDSSEDDTGNGDIVIDFSNVADAQDVAVYDQNGNLLDYEIESLDTSAETGVLWAYNSWVRDGTTQAQLAYGNNSANTDRQNVTGTWGNAGQDSIIRELNGDLRDPADVIITEARLYDKQVSDSFIQAEFDASPKAGQVFFTQDAAQAISADQTVSIPETQVTASNPDPQLNATVQVSIPGTTATTVNPAPTVSPGTATVNVAETQLSSTNPGFTVQAGETTVQTPVNTLTTSNPNPEINAFNEISVPETQLNVSNPNPALTISELILAPETQLNVSNPDIQVQPGATQINIQETTITATFPEPGLNRKIVLGVNTQLTAENPEPQLEPGAVTVQLEETSATVQNPDLQLQPGETVIQAERPTNLETFNPEFNIEAGQVQIDVQETALSLSTPAPSLGFNLQFVSPTQAVITNNERYFDMADHTFTQNDLGDVLTATLKDDENRDGVDLAGSTEVRLIIENSKKEKVQDKEMTVSSPQDGEVEYSWDQDDIITDAGVYRAKIQVFDSTGERESFPNDGYRTIEIEEEIQ